MQVADLTTFQYSKLLDVDDDTYSITWEESVKRDLKDWCITKELALDKREWKLAIHVLGP
jgi:hypothetical protein